MLKIYLIRHGQTEWNLLNQMQGTMNSNLTSQGKTQAISLGKKLESFNFNKIYSSSTARAVETSKLIFPDKFISYSTYLCEIAMGEWEGKTYSQIQENDPTEWDNFFNAPFNYKPSSGGESFNQLEKRLKNFITTENLFNQEGAIAIISHRITLRMFLSILLKEKKLFSDIDLNPTSLSLIEIDNGTCTIKYLNNTSHY
ncbi:histidine phosphatase family protein [Enterococcus faecalis]|uniref:histidine phosphatase family protein n=1 Tax=Enterococcus faecalis TaxID=1351 RepID=UPI0027F27EAD|nr:histidine phosphatase family protein [Enterococcus faecalis]EKZ0407294.1 histidine phosphatase family protein [Enterococcus faecalis]MDT2086714.1 histidine phosphatase family protein [Enterococcus faecalis]